MSPKDNNKQVSAAVRILQQKRDASARATHLMVKNDSLITYETGILGQAVVKKFFAATFLERKIMSTKTITKRIALVAASALALGGFSVISAPQASATPATMPAFVWSKTTTTGPAQTALVTGKYTASTVLNANGISSFTVTAGDTVVPHFAPTSGTSGATTDSLTIGIKGLGNLILNDTMTASQTDFTSANGIKHFTATSVPGTYTLVATVLVPAVSGSYSLTSEVTMVVEAGTTLSVPLSSALIAASGSPSTTTDAIPVSASRSLSSTAAAVIQVDLKNADATDATSGNTLSATVTGPGYVTWSTGSAVACSTTPTYSATVGRSITAQATDALGLMNVCADGSSGTATIAISITNAAGVTTALSTKTVTFFGSVASIAINTTNFTIGAAGGALTGSATGAGTSDTITYMPAFTVVTKASDGTAANIASSGVPTIVSSASTVVASGICARDNNATYGSGTTGYYGCSFTTASSAKSGDKATLTVRTSDPASSTGAFLTTTIEVTVGGSVAKEVISFDKNAYSTGEGMVVTITATDSSGNPVADGRTSPALTGSKAVGGALPAAGYYVGGKKATTAGALWAPAIGGDFTVVGTGTDAAATAISATATIDGDQSSSLALDAANAATDAANNAYDEAQNATQAASDALAAVTALAKQVKSLIASVKKLTKSVAKLS
jgi:trimeric autotransporter adhesin